MNSRWFREALDDSRLVDLGEGHEADIISTPVFIATKLEAYRDRGRGDFRASHDIEDIVTVIDGCEAIVGQIVAAPANVREFVVTELATWRQSAAIVEEVAGHLSPMSQFADRVNLVMDRISAIARLQS